MLTGRWELCSPAGMANFLGDEKKHQVLALGRLGWPLRRIEHATGVRRETASAYLKAAGIATRDPASAGRRQSRPVRCPPRPQAVDDRQAGVREGPEL
jgi:hypothetical protein